MDGRVNKAMKSSTREQAGACPKLLELGLGASAGARYVVLPHKSIE